MSATKRIIKNSLIMYIITGIALIIGFFNSRIIINTLGVEDFGIYSLIFGFVLLFSVLNGSMSSSVQRFLSVSLGKNDIKEMNEYFNAAIIIHIGLALIVFIVAKTAGEWFLVNKLKIPELRTNAAYWVFQTTIMAFLFQIVSTPAQAMLTAYEKMGTLALITMLTPVGKLIAILVADKVTNHDRLISFAMITLFFSFLQLVFFYICGQSDSTHIGLIKDRQKYKELSSFAGWSLFGNLALVAKNQGTAIILNLFFGAGINAAYGVSNQLLSQFTQLSSMVTRAANPQIIKNYAVGNKAQSFKLVTQLSKISFSILFLITLPFFLETDFILMFWLKKVPPFAVPFLQLGTIVALIEVGSIPLMVLSKATGKIKLYQATVGGLLLLGIPIAYSVLNRGGSPETVFYVFSGIAVIALFARLIILRTIATLPVMGFFYETILKTSVFAVTIILIGIVPGHYMKTQVLVVRVYHFILLPLISAFGAWYFILTRAERKGIITMFVRKQ